MENKHKISQEEFEKLWENDDDVCWDFPIIAKKKDSADDKKEEPKEGD